MPTFEFSRPLQLTSGPKIIPSFGPESSWPWPYWLDPRLLPTVTTIILQPPSLPTFVIFD